MSTLSAQELLWALDLSPSDTIVELGSSTESSTDDGVPHTGAA